MQGGRGRAARGRSGRGGGRGRRQQHDMSSTTSSSDVSNKNYGTNNQWRQNQKSGRGVGGRHNNTRATPSQQTSYNKPINIETTNFQSIFNNTST